MRLVGAIVLVTILTRAGRLSKWRRLPTDEHVTEYYTDNEHEERCLAIGTLRLWIWQQSTNCTNTSYVVGSSTLVSIEQKVWSIQPTGCG